MAIVLMPLAQGFEEIEAFSVVDILRRSNIEVILAGLDPDAVTGGHNIRIIPDTTIDAITTATFNAIILPGGQPGTDNLKADPRIHALLNEFAEKDKLICAICAAPIVLAAAGLLNGKRVTCYPSYQSKLDGGIYESSPVVTDGNLITSKGVGTAFRFGLTIAARLAGRTTAENVAKAMLIDDYQF